MFMDMQIYIKKRKGEIDKQITIQIDRKINRQIFRQTEKEIYRERKKELERQNSFCKYLNRQKKHFRVGTVDKKHVGLLGEMRQQFQDQLIRTSMVLAGQQTCDYL